MKTLKNNTHYWYRHTGNSEWIVGYVCKDDKGRQWLHRIGKHPLPLDLFGMSSWEFKENKPPTVMPLGMTRSTGMASIELAVRVIDSKNKMYFGVRCPDGTVGFYVEPSDVVGNGIRREAESLLQEIVEAR